MDLIDMLRSIEGITDIQISTACDFVENLRKDITLLQDNLAQVDKIVDEYSSDDDENHVCDECLHIKIRNLEIEKLRYQTLYKKARADLEDVQAKVPVMTKSQRRNARKKIRKEMFSIPPPAYEFIRA
jgi:hypothetical protein